MKKCNTLICIFFLSITCVFAQEYSDIADESIIVTYEDDFDTNEDDDFVMTAEEFDELFEADTISNKHITKKKSEVKKEKVTSESVKTTSDTTVNTPAKKTNKKSGASVDIAVSTTNMFYDKTPAVMYPFDNNPYFVYVDMKFTGALNPFIYGGATLDVGIGEYGNKLNRKDDVSKYCYDVSLLNGFSIPVGHILRFYVEDNVNFSINILNQTKPEYHKATRDFAWGYGIGGGMDILIDDWFISIGYNYNWKHYISNADNFRFFNADYCQTAIYAGVGISW